MALKSYKHSETRKGEKWSIEFTREDGSGYSFPCDKDGNIQFTGEVMQRTYQRCLAEGKAEYPVAFNFKEYDCWDYRTNPEGDCVCGEHIELWNEYMGACQCPNCGRWYNLSGQELLPPEMWEPDDPYYD